MPRVSLILGDVGVFVGGLVGNFPSIHFRSPQYPASGNLTGQPKRGIAINATRDLSILNRRLSGWLGRFLVSGRARRGAGILLPRILSKSRSCVRWSDKQTENDRRAEKSHLLNST